MGGKSNKPTVTELQDLCQPVVEQNKSLLGRSAGKSALRGIYGRTRLDILDILDAFPFYVLLVDADHYILEANSFFSTIDDQPRLVTMR